jgi:hypothetical protein
MEQKYRLYGVLSLGLQVHVYALKNSNILLMHVAHTLLL